QWDGQINHALKFLCPHLTYQGVRIFALGQEQKLDLSAVFHGGQGAFQSAVRSTASGFIAVKAKYHFAGVAKGAFQMVLAASSSKGGNAITDAKLSQADNVHIAFYNQ